MSNTDVLWENRWDRFSRHPLRWFVLVVLGIVVLGFAIGIGAWRLHWWFYQQGVGLEYKANINSQPYQTSLVTELRNDARDYYVSDNPAQQTYIKNQFCTVYLNLSPSPDTTPALHDLAVAHQQLCP